jgi:hypothetical protein
MIHTAHMKNTLHIERLIVAFVAAVALGTSCGGSSSTSDASDAEADLAADSPQDVGAAPEVSTTGSGKPNGTACAKASQCASGFCADGVCCDSDCTDVCRSCSLTGHAGTCSPVLAAQDPGACDGDNICSAQGSCGKVLGQACGGAADCASGNCVNGVCCNETCGKCQACNLPGTMGNCAPLPKLTDDAVGGCNGDMTCDGLGQCKLKNGRACATGGASCASSFCSDSLCCDTSCRDSCHGCALAGKEGTCSVIAGQDDTDANVTCGGVNTCDFAGGATCKLKEGQACTAGADCASGGCPSFYEDTDQDGYGALATLVRQCNANATPPAGFVTMAGDCCDRDWSTHPGQTGYFTQANACGSFDYNCSGNTEEKYTMCPGWPVPPGCGANCVTGLKPPTIAFVQACH